VLFFLWGGREHFKFSTLINAKSAVYFGLALTG
jgi:hypothetical protein